MFKTLICVDVDGIKPIKPVFEICLRWFFANDGFRSSTQPTNIGGYKEWVKVCPNYSRFAVYEVSGKDTLN